MITLAQMCEAFKKHMDPFLETIFIKLFKKALDTNSFIIQEVNKCIRSLICYCSNHKISNIIINNSQSKAVPIKVKVAFCIRQLFEKEDFKVGMLRQNPKIVGVMGCYITDGSQEVRNMTRQTFMHIQSNNPQQQIQTIFRKSPKQIWEKWRTILDRNLK